MACILAIGVNGTGLHAMSPMKGKHCVPTMTKKALGSSRGMITYQP